jgi:flagellar motor switch protein FliM
MAEEAKEVDVQDATREVIGEKKKEKKIKDYDFRRPEKLSKEQFRSLELIYESFCRLLSSSLSGQLRMMIRVQLLSISQMLYLEFMQSLPAPTVIGVFTSEPLEGEMIIEVNPSIAFNIIDRLLGGSGGSEVSARELTEIEQSIFSGIVNKMLSHLKECWAELMDIKPSLVNIEANPTFVQIVPPNDIVVVSAVEIKIGEMTGQMNICMPFISLEPIIEKLSSQQRYSVGQASKTEESLEKMKNVVSRLEVLVTAELGVADVTLNDLLQLQVGDVIKLDTLAKDDLIIKVDEKPKFKCRPGTIGKRLAVQITDIIEE